MENDAERVVGATVGVNRRVEGVSETSKEWVAPELRKVEIAEVTAVHVTMAHDAGMGS